MTRAGALAAAILAAGLVLAALSGLLLLMGDCWASSDTPAATRLCEIEKRREVFAYLVIAPLMWLAGVVLAMRKRPYGPLVGLLSGPVCYAAAGAVF
ncbi:hypothetical protein ACLBKU_07105 [Erythrobacter sp. NE805]|uniref:hypothetical protein n=1 Tax=Erythrobacter sp. NE805 TaxID=3389875 RepID=UPI00396B2CF9